MTAPLDISALLPVDGTTVMNAASVAGPMNKFVAAYDSHITNVAVAGYGPDNHKTDAILPFAALPLTTNRAFTPNTQHAANDMFATAWLDAVTGSRASWDTATVTTPLNTLAATVNAATNANTASTIVKRDGSGNFIAGTITADLSGNATGVKGVTAGGLLIGAGAGAMTTLAAGTNLFVLTSNGAGVAPSWQAATGGGGGTTADTGLYATQGANDVALSRFLFLTVTGNVIGAITAGTTAGTLTLTVGSGAPPIVVEGYGRRQEASFGHIPVSGVVSVAGIYTLLADVSGATNYFGLVLSAGVVNSANNQVPLCQVYFDGTAFYLTAPHGPYYPGQPVVNGANFAPLRNTVIYADTAALTTLSAITQLPSTNALTFNVPVQGLTAWIDFRGQVSSTASTGDFRIYPMYSSGAGTALSALGTGYSRKNPTVASTVEVQSGFVKLSNLGSGPQNFGLAYFTTVTGYTIVEPQLKVEITR